jgi:hypothetical protein
VTRRHFLQHLSQSLLVLSLAEFTSTRKLIAGPVAGVIDTWLQRVNELARSLQQSKIAQTEWQQTMGELYRRLELTEFLESIKFDDLIRNLTLPSTGEYFSAYAFPEIAGLPAEPAFFSDFAGFRKGYSIPPHGHNHLVSSFLVLRGNLRGQHFDRIADEADGIVVKPSGDRIFGPGDFSTVTQTQNNIHGFTSLSEGAFIFDFGVGGLKAAGTTRPLPDQNPLKSGRIYLDILKPERIGNAGLRVRRLSEVDAYRLYG